MVFGGVVVRLLAALATAARGSTNADDRRLRSDLGRVVLVDLEVVSVADTVRAPWRRPPSGPADTTGP